MDNLAHTLAGLALAEAGLKRRTALGTATLAIGANLPDVDAAAYFLGSGLDALVFRRGWTHGVLAMVVLPLLLAASMAAWDRLVRRRSGGARTAVHIPSLLLLAAIGIWSHPLLDLLNTYGVRLLMPFSGRWFYGDTLFIIDPWLLLVLGGGVVLSRMRGRGLTNRPARVGWRGDGATRPARIAIAAFLAYVIVMAASSRAGRTLVRSQSGPAALSVMVAPVPFTPLRRAVVVDFGDRYETGTLDWTRGGAHTRDFSLPTGADDPAARAAARTRDGARFLSWSRFPRYFSERSGDSIRVRISDLRYADEGGRGWASVEIMVPAAHPAQR